MPECPISVEQQIGESMRTWRCSLAQRVLGIMLTMFILGCGLYFIFVARPSAVNSRSDLLVVGLAYLALSPIPLWVFWRPKLCVDSLGLTIVGVFRTVRLSRSEICEVYSEQDGLKIKTSRRRRPYTAWSVQRCSYLVYLRGVQPRADRVAKEIREWSSSASPGLSSRS